MIPKRERVPPSRRRVQQRHADRLARDLYLDGQRLARPLLGHGRRDGRAAGGELSRAAFGNATFACDRGAHPMLPVALRYLISNILILMV